MESGGEIRFPVGENPRLAAGTDQQLNHIELSPFGLHCRSWMRTYPFTACSKAITASFRKNSKPDRPVLGNTNSPANHSEGAATASLAFGGNKKVHGCRMTRRATAP